MRSSRWTTSFRTHDALLTPLNDLTTFLGDLHEPLSASRQCAPGRGPYVEAYTLEEPSRLRSERLEQEARLIALRVRALLDRQVLVHDGEVERPVEPKDIAVLARHKAPLSVYAEALAKAGVPFLQGDTDDLLATREAQDGTALLRFLADPNDDLALLTLLRKPLFRPQRQRFADDSCRQDQRAELVGARPGERVALPGKCQGYPP